MEKEKQTAPKKRLAVSILTADMANLGLESKNFM